MTQKKGVNGATNGTDALNQKNGVNGATNGTDALTKNKEAPANKSKDGEVTLKIMQDFSQKKAEAAAVEQIIPQKKKITFGEFM